MNNNSQDNATSLAGSSFLRGPLQLPSLIGLMVFYVVILVVGILASLKSKTWKRGEADSEHTMLAGRNMGVLLGIFTMTATWVGGGFINGSAEAVYSDGQGLAWTQAPWGYSLSIFFNGVFFAKKFRERKYVTLLDPIQQHYGRLTTAILYIPSFVGDIFWCASILSALGGTLVVIVGLSHEWSIATSAAIAVVYTLFGGLFSVALTDVLQLAFIFVGLWLATGFAFAHHAVTPISETAYTMLTPEGEEKIGWLGVFPSGPEIGLWFDNALIIIVGGIPWQVYYQRACSQKTAFRAQVLSFTATAGCLILALPAVLLGAVAKSTDWNATDYQGTIPFPAKDAKLALPLVFQFLTPMPVAMIGLGAVSAAVMSSCDSCILSAASMFARNVHASIREELQDRGYTKTKASEREILWVMRGGIVFVGFAACTIAFRVTSVYSLFVLCSDFVYILVFPALVCAIYIEWVNYIGILSGIVVGMFFRFTGGDALLDFPALIPYPFYNEETGFNIFPYKSLSMLSNFGTALAVSLVTNWRCHVADRQEEIRKRGEVALEKEYELVVSQDEKPSSI